MNEQAGIFDEASCKFYFLEYSLKGSPNIGRVCSVLRHCLQDVSPSVNLVVAFGANALKKLAPELLPSGFRNYENIVGPDNYSSMSTQQDILFWVHSQNHDDNFDQVLKINAAMSDVAKLTLDLPGFTYHDSRDLIGFVDGTANPKGEGQREAALIPEGDAGAGGSFILSQKWVHNLDAFNALGVNEQEKIVGRTKKDSIELEGKDMPVDSHVSRTDLTLNGKPAKIYRRSAPFGSATEHGLYFLAFSCDIERFDLQLKSMFGVTGDGLHDRIIEFSEPVTSSYWFAPSKRDLQDMLNS